MVKNAARHLLVLVLCFSISFSICGCFWGVKFSTREELEPKVIEYIQEKYDFTPQINDWKSETVMNRREHYAALSDGSKDFFVHVDYDNCITDNFETDRFDAAVTEWFDSKFAGIYRAHVEESFYGLDEKYEDGDIWKFYGSHKDSIRITAAYTDISFADAPSMSFLSELDRMDIYYTVSFLACPSDEAAQVVWDKSFPNGYRDIICYAPYVSESYQVKPNAAPDFKTYEVRYYGDVGYIQYLDYDNEPMPFDTYSVASSDISLSDVCPTYKIDTNFINGDDKINIWFFIPMSQINDEIVFLDYFGSIQVNNMDYVYGKSAKETHLGGYCVYGEYAGFKINDINGDLYFSVKSHKK